MAALSLRRATPDDAHQVRAVTREAYAKWVPLIGREPLPMAADHEAAIRAHLVDLLDGPDGVEALIELIPHPDHLLVENVAVRPACQGRGHGRRLMAHAEDVARTFGLATLRLYTNQRFAENIALYSRLGYTIDREVPYPTGGVVVHMLKRL